MFQMCTVGYIYLTLKSVPTERVYQGGKEKDGSKNNQMTSSKPRCGCEERF